jgi:hypothetical protein
MGVFLQVLGILFLLLILLVIGGILLIRARLRSALKGLEDLKYGVTPARIHLHRRQELEWKDPAAAAASLDAIRGLGFQEVGPFGIEEMDFIRMHALVRPDDHAYAVVYEHDKVGVWVDFVTRYEDGTSITYANTAQGGEVDQRPGHGTVRAPGLDPPALYRRFLAERPQRAMKTPSADDFQTTFERAYADEMDWRNSRGGPTEEEIRAVAAASGEEIDEATLAAAREALAEQAAAGLQEALMERFLEKTTLSASRWEELRDRVVFVHDRLTAEMTVSTFTDWTEPPDDEDEAWEKRLQDVRDTSPRASFAAWNEAAPEGRRFERIDTLTEPVPADVYVAPEQDWEEEDPDEE